MLKSTVVFFFGICHYLKVFNISKHEIPVGNYMFKVNNRNTRKRCEICSKLTIKIPEQRHWPRFRVFIVNFEHI